MIKIGIINVGHANYHSIINAIKFCGYDYELIDKPIKKDISHLILPGVGDFGTIAKKLRKTSLDKYIFSHIEKQRMFLGICVGFQLMFCESEESRNVKGLELFKGKIEKLDKFVKIIPNIGWRNVDIKESKILDKKSKNIFYFAHSYCLIETSQKNYSSSIKLNKQKIITSIEQDNIFGVQFHPEKSADSGIKLLNNFCSYKI